MMRHIMIFLDASFGALLVAPKLATPYHLLLQREQLGTSGFECPLALIERRGTAEVREAQADIVEAGVGRRADLGEMTLFPRFPPPRGGPRPRRSVPKALRVAMIPMPLVPTADPP